MLSKRVRFSYGIDDNGLSDVNIDFLSRFHVIGPQLLVHRMEQRVYKTGTETIPALQSSTLIWQPRSLFLLCDTKLACCSILYWRRRRQGAAEECVLQIQIYRDTVKSLVSFFYFFSSVKMKLPLVTLPQYLKGKIRRWLQVWRKSKLWQWQYLNDLYHVWFSLKCTLLSHNITSTPFSILIIIHCQKARSLFVF